MLTECVNCGFFIRQNDEFCLNCGSKISGEELSISNEKAILISGLISPVISFLIINYLLQGSSNFSFIFYFFSFAILFLFSFCLIYFSIHNFYEIGRKKNLRSSLIDKDEIISKRTSELNKRWQKIDSVLDKIRDTDGEKLKNVRIKLLKAREVVISQFALYELQAKKIELVRLQNGVSPYLFGWHRLDESETENGLATIENTQQQINKIWQNLTSYAAIEFPEKTLPEKQNFLSQLDETETSCEKLREALLSRQAARALQEISPIEENLNLPDAKEVVHEAETFNIQMILTDFSESFDKLEHEYKRLKAEEELGQKLLKN